MWGFTRSFASRGAALAVALTLSGAAELVERPAGPAGHRCHCPVRNGQHDCDCPLCHAEASRLGKAAADDPNLPPCHRALAAKARADATRSDARRAASAPCLTSACGTSERTLRPPPGADRFLVPPRWQVAPIDAPVGEPASRGRLLAVVREPETPPPRPA